MAKIQSVKKLIVEDFSSDDKTLVTKIATVLNPFLDQVVTALSGRLSFGDNIKSKVYTFDLAAGVSSIVVAWDFNEKPTAVYIGNLTKAAGVAPSSAFSMSSYHADKKITLTFLGLDAGSEHKVTVIAQI